MKTTKSEKVLAIAKKLCTANNTVSNLEIKNELRRRYPYNRWDQKEISSIMNGYFQDGIFNFTDNGTFRVYSLKNVNSLKSTKPTPQQLQQIPLTSNSVRTYGQIVNILCNCLDLTVKDIKVNSNLVETLGADDLDLVEIAMEMENTFNISIPDGEILDLITPRKYLNYINKKMKTTTKTKAAPLATITKSKTNRVSTSNRISKSKALDLIKNSNGKFFTVTFIKKDGTRRVMNGQHTTDMGVSSLGYINVKDITAVRRKETATIKSVNLQTIESIRLNSVTYKVA